MKPKLAFNKEKNGRKGTLSLLAVMLLFCLVFSSAANATVNITTARVFNSANAAKLDQSADDADPTVGVVHIIGDLNINAGGSLTSGGVPIIINIDGALNVTTGRFISGDEQLFGDSIHIVAGGNISLFGSATIHSNSLIFTNNTTGGNISLISNTGNISIPFGSSVTVDGNIGGQIILQTLAPTGTITIGGLVESVGHVSGTGAPGGGPIFIYAGCTLTVTYQGKVQSVGQDPGADLVHLSACRVYINGYVASTGAGHVLAGGKKLKAPYRPDKDPNSNAAIEVWGDSIFIDASGTNVGQLNADLTLGASGTSWIDVLAGHYISVKGKTTVYPIHAVVGGCGGHGGDVNIKSLNGSVFSSGFFVNASSNGSCVTLGGDVNVHSLTDLTLGTSIKSTQGGSIGTGGPVDLHSFTGKINYSSPTNVNVTNGGSVTTSNCLGITGSLTVTGAVAVNNSSCAGAPDISSQPYVVIPQGCVAGDCVCRHDNLCVKLCPVFTTFLPSGPHHPSDRTENWSFIRTFISRGGSVYSKLAQKLASIIISGTSHRTPATDWNI